MKTKGKRAVGIGVLALIGLAFWMRALASWRPVTVAKVGFSLSKIQVSRDGKWLLVTTRGGGGGGAVVDLEKADYSMDSDRVRAFAQEHGTETFPHISWQEGAIQPDFWPSSGHKIPLSGLNRAGGLGYFNDGTPIFPVGWSKDRGEVFCALKGVLWVCNWRDGKLKKRVRYAKSTSPQAVFSPDGSLLLSVESTMKNGMPWATLSLYSTFNGQLVGSPIQHNEFRDFGFSPDGRWEWFTGSRGNSPNLEVLPVAGKETAMVFSADSQGPVKWLSIEVLGIVEADGFRWRNAQGETLGQLPGPFQLPGVQGAHGHITDWALSPDENWIYSCEEDGTIRRWRATAHFARRNFALFVASA